jgi:hypothetical protein
MLLRDPATTFCYTGFAMAHLLQPRWTKRNPHTGEKETRRTRRWYGVWRDSQGTRHRDPLLRACLCASPVGWYKRRVVRGWESAHRSLPLS